MVTTEHRTSESAQPAQIRQYTLAGVLGIWASAAIPMAVLAWGVAPRPDFRRPWADAGLLTDVAAGRPPHALARHVGTRPPHVACAHVGVSQPAGEKRPSARTPAGPGPRRSVAARPIAQARTRSRLICERGACAYQLRKPGPNARCSRRPGPHRLLAGRRRCRSLRPRAGTSSVSRWSSRRSGWSARP